MSKARSSKAKGNRGTKIVRDLILTYFPLDLDDVRTVPSSVPGDDLWLSPKAREMYNYDTEVKNNETVSVWAAWKQVTARCGAKKPMVVMMRNYQKPVMVIDAAHGYEILSELYRLKNDPKKDTTEQGSV